MKKNLILGTAIGYNYYHIHRFLFTLKRTGYTGDVCLFAHEHIGKRTRRKLREQGVIVELVHSKFPFLDRPHPENFRTLPSPIHLFNYRHYLYYDYLLRNGGKYGYVMLSDIRDVVFQRDPFGFDIGTSLCVAMESRDKTIAQCSVNSEWLINGYGNDVLDKIGHQQISCAGTTWGSVSVIREYIRLMLEEICVVRDAYRCIDQGIHNYVVHTGKIADVRKLTNEEGIVMTMLYLKKYRMNGNGEVINPAGEVVRVLHQYDHHPSLAGTIDSLAFSGPWDKCLQKYIWKLLP